MSERITAWLLVGVQVVLLVAVVLVPAAEHWPDLSPAGLVLGAAGIGLGLSAIAVFGRGVTPSPLPAAAASLVTQGPYRWIRHPMYTAVTILCVGIVLRSRNWVGLVIVVLLGSFFAFKARWEEHRLVDAYAGYREYAARTGRFLPGVGPLSRNAGGRGRGA